MEPLDFFVMGCRVGAAFPADMPWYYRAQIARCALNGTYAAVVNGIEVRKPGAYALRIVERKVSTWATPAWEVVKDEFGRHWHIRSKLPSVLDSAAVVWAMYEAGDVGRNQLAAITGHGTCATCTDESCCYCAPIKAGDWATLAAKTGLDRVTAENAYRSLEECGLVGPAMRPASRGVRGERPSDVSWMAQQNEDFFADPDYQSAMSSDAVPLAEYLRTHSSAGMLPHPNDDF